MNEDVFREQATKYLSSISTNYQELVKGKSENSINEKESSLSTTDEKRYHDDLEEEEEDDEENSTREFNRLYPTDSWKINNSNEKELITGEKSNICNEFNLLKNDFSTKCLRFVHSKNDYFPIATLSIIPLLTKQHFDLNSRTVSEVNRQDDWLLSYDDDRFAIVKKQQCQLYQDLLWSVISHYEVLDIKVSIASSDDAFNVQHKSSKTHTKFIDMLSFNSFFDEVNSIQLALLETSMEEILENSHLKEILERRYYKRSKSSRSTESRTKTDELFSKKPLFRGDRQRMISVNEVQTDEQRKNFIRKRVRSERQTNLSSGENNVIEPFFNSNFHQNDFIPLNTLEQINSSNVSNKSNEKEEKVGEYEEDEVEEYDEEEERLLNVDVDRLTNLFISRRMQLEMRYYETRKQSLEFYDATLLDSKQFISGKHKTKLIFPSTIISLIDYATFAERKNEINTTFSELHPQIHLSLTKLRSIKRQLFFISDRLSIDLGIVALSYVYFERVVLKGLVTKSNRKAVAAACLLLAGKLHDIHKEMKLKKLFNEFEATFRLEKKRILSLEFPVLVALGFSLFPNLYHRDFMIHYQRLLSMLQPIKLSE